MDIWREGNLEDILLEGRCIQKGHSMTPPIAKTFQRSMSSGKDNKALQCLSRNSSGGVLALN